MKRIILLTFSLLVVLLANALAEVNRAERKNHDDNSITVTNVVVFKQSDKELKHITIELTCNADGTAVSSIKRYYKLRDAVREALVRGRNAGNNKEKEGVINLNYEEIESEIQLIDNSKNEVWKINKDNTYEYKDKITKDDIIMLLGISNNADAVNPFALANPKNVSITVTVTFPGNVIEANTGSFEGRTAVWKTSSARFINFNKEKKLYAKCGAEAEEAKKFFNEKYGNMLKNLQQHKKAVKMGIFSVAAKKTFIIGLKLNEQNGELIVDDILKKDLEEKYNIKKNDIILEVNGLEISYVEELREEINEAAEREEKTVKLTIKRGKNLIKIEAPIVEDEPQPAPSTQPAPSPRKLKQPMLKFEEIDIDKE